MVNTYSTKFNMGDPNLVLSPVWEHSLTSSMGHPPDTDPGRSLRIWVQYQGIQNFLDLLSWNHDEFKQDHSQTVYDINQDHPVHLRTNQIKQITGLMYYMRYIFLDYC